MTGPEAVSGPALPAETTAAYVSEVVVPVGEKTQYSVASLLFGQPDGWP